MAWRIALAALLLGWSAASYARHSFAVLDPRRASPGLSLQLAEVPSGGNGNGVRYALRAAGFPQSVTFGVWTRDFGRDFQELMSGIQFDAKGVPSGTDLAKGADGIEVDSGPYPKGAAWMVAIASEDHKLAAFARVIPHPIEARDGRCAVSLELVSLYGTRFVASGTGFAPGEDVRIESISGTLVTYRTLRISADGSLPIDVVSHGKIGVAQSARYTVKARGCQPVINYEWGEPALRRY